MEITGLDIKIEKKEQVSDFAGRLQDYPYALFYYLSEVKLVALEGEPIWNLDQLIEARLFSKEKELHIFQHEEGWQAVCIKEIGQAEYIDEWCLLSRKFQTVGKQLGVRRYLSYDEDGQIYVALTRLYAVKGGN